MERTPTPPTLAPLTPEELSTKVEEIKAGYRKILEQLLVKNLPQIQTLVQEHRELELEVTLQAKPKAPPRPQLVRSPPRLNGRM